MPSFIGELKRRNVFRVAIAYCAVSWLLLQACGLIFDAFELPHVVMRVVFVVLVLGFMPAMIFSWAYELTPDGLKRDTEVDPADSSARDRTQTRLHHHRRADGDRVPAAGGSFHDPSCGMARTGGDGGPGGEAAL